MCDAVKLRRSPGGLRIAAAACLLATVVTTAPRSLAAQDGPDASLEERIEALEVEIQARIPDVEAAVERARRAEERRDSIRRANRGVETDTLAIGPLTVVTVPEDAEEARRFVSRIWSEEFESWLGSDAEGIFDDVVLSFQYGPRRRHIEVRGPALHVSERSWWPEAGVERAIRSVLQNHVRVRLLPGDLRAWIENGAFALDDPARLYRRLALARSDVAHECFEGRAEACLTALGLGDSDPATWYGDAHLAALARDPRFDATFGCFVRPGSEWCEEAGTVSPTLGFRWLPMPRVLRASFLWYTLQRGGEGALERLVEGRDDPHVRSPTEFGAVYRERFEAAGGVDAPELAEGWRAWIFTGKPSEGHADVPTRARLSAFLWIVFFAALATRSKRCRLG